VFSRFQFGVFRGAGLFDAMRSVTVLFGKLSAKKPVSSNMSRVTLPKKLFGELCQPPRSSLTIFDDSVERSQIDPTVRYEVWKP
jgi:hypothetical protein